MAFLDKLKELFASGATPPGMSAAAARKLRGAIERESKKPPRIAVIGETGVGKTSTINAIFNQGLPISHERACTKSETEIIGNKGGPVRVVDMPGFGEDVAADKEHLETYRRILPGVDVAVWILKADNRAITGVQTTLRRLKKERVLQPRRLVVALNQVDLLHPGNWDGTINQPSPEQERTIEARRRDVVEKLRQIVKLREDQIVAYSAVKFHNLDPLFEAMVVGCEEHRRWLLVDRASCADFNQLIDERALVAGAE